MHIVRKIRDEGNFMQKKIVGLTLCVVICLACALGMVACNKDEGNAVDVEFALPIGSRPSYASLFSAEDKALIDKAVAGNATDEEMKEAVMVLYNTANYSRINTAKSLVVQESLANPKNKFAALATIKMHAVNLRNGDKWYYQLATNVDAGDPTLNAMFSIWSGYLKVGYCKGTDDNGDGELDYYYFGEVGADYNCDVSVGTFPYATITFPEGTKPFQESMTLAEFNYELNVLKEIHEINNMDFCKEIIADGAKITFENNIYKVEFSVDTNADSELLAKWFAMPKKDMAVGGQTLTKYNYYNATLEVWDNGYAKYFESSSDREAGMGSGSPVDKYAYVWNDDEIVDIVCTDTAIAEYNENSAKNEQVDNIDKCLEFYTDHDHFQFVARKLNVFEVAGIVMGCIVAVVIAIVVTIEVLVKKGKLPKLAQRRADAKAKRLAKKRAKNGLSEDTQEAQNSIDDVVADENNAENNEFNNGAQDDEAEKNVAADAIIIDYSDRLGDGTVFDGDEAVVSRNEESNDEAFGVAPHDAKVDEDKENR